MAKKHSRKRPEDYTPQPIPSHPGFRNLSGQTFGYIVIDVYLGPERGHQIWGGRCTRCGGRAVARANNLLTGHTTSCNCLHADNIKSGKCRARHRKSHSPEWVAWQAMKARCCRESSPDYKQYGAKGIRPCAGFLASFDHFYAVMGDRPSKGHSLDRINGTRGYDCGRCEDCKGRGASCNVRWATRVVQNRNRWCARLLDVNGTKKSIAEWADEKGIRPGTISARLGYGWSEADAVTVPVR